MHVPVEMYGFISCTLEGSVEEAVEAYRAIAAAVKPQPISDINSKEWLELYSTVASGKPYQGDPGILDSLNPLQRFAINEAKKFIKRNK